MALDLRKLNMLKMKLMQDKELKDVMNYFFDHFGEDEAFLDLSKPTRHEMLEAILGQTVGPLVGSKTKVVLANFLLLHVPNHEFYHGAFMVKGKLANVIYFDDIKMGCIAIAMSMAGNTNFMRFSAQELSHKPSSPSLN